MKKIYIFYAAISIMILCIYLFNHRFFNKHIIEGASSDDPFQYDISSPAFRPDGTNSTDKPTNDEMLAAFLSGIYMYISQADHEDKKSPQGNVNICTKLVTATKIYYFLNTYSDYSIEEISQVFPRHFQNSQSLDVFYSMILSSEILYNSLIEDSDGSLKTGVNTQDTCDPKIWDKYTRLLKKPFKNIRDSLAFLTSQPPGGITGSDTEHTEY